MTNQEIRMKELIEKLNDPNTLDKNDTLYNELDLLQSLTGVVLPNSPIKKSESGESMEKVIDIIKQLKATSGRKDKESILESNKTNELLKRVLHFVYNPYIVTGLSSKKINKDLPKIDEKPLDFVDLLDYFAKNCTGRDIDIQIAQNFLNSVEKDVDFYKEVLTKDLKIGCTSKTLNKIYGDDFIEEFNVMLAQKYSDNAEKVEGKQYTITEKRDGNRCVFIKENGIIKAFTRQGQVYEGLVDLERGLGELEIDNVAIDGELMVLNDHEIDAAEQFKATMKIVRKDGEKHGVKLVVFDYMPLEDFKKGICKTPYSQRRLNLEKDFKDTKFFEPVKKLYQGKDISMISKLLDEVTSKGGEGLMVNIDDAPYECKRTDKLLKVKKMLTCDVLVLDIYEGTGRNVGKLGGITIQFKNQKDELCKCNCGSGFTDEERDRYWKNKDLLIGKIVELDYFDITQDSKTKEYGLRFPIWKSIIRHDKTEISMY